MKLPFYISEALKAYFEVASEDRRALLDIELFNTDPLSCKKEYLPLLAVEAGVDIDGFEEQRQREMIENAYSFLTKAGTIGYLKKMLIGAEIKEWFDYNGEPYSFKVKIINGYGVKILENKIFTKLENKINTYKNVRSKLDSFNIILQTDNHLFYGSLIQSSAIITIYPKETLS